MTQHDEFDGLVQRLRLLNEQNHWPSLLEAATAIQTLQSRLAESEARGAAVRKVRDGYADQAKFADHEQAAYFREFVRRLDAIFLANPENSHGNA